MPDQLLLYPRAAEGLITVDRRDYAYSDWGFDDRIYPIPPAGSGYISLEAIRLRTFEYTEAYDLPTPAEPICNDYYTHLRTHGRWVGENGRRTTFAEPTCQICDEWTEPRRCTNDYCRVCWPPPTSTTRYHQLYRSWAERRAGASPWAYRGNPCDRQDCTICRPLWAMSLVELARVNVRRQRRRWEDHVSERRYQRVQEIQRTAAQRAAALLKELCTDEQWTTYLSEGHIPVVGSNGGRYLITSGYSGNVIVGEDPENRYEYLRRKCAHPNMTEWVDIDNLGKDYIRMPDEDAMIAQMLCIQADEDEWLSIANNY